MSTAMSTFATFCAVVATLNGIILLGSVSPASAYQSSSIERDIGKNFLVFSESAFENNTLYYGVCDRTANQTQKECTLHRVLADISGGSPKEDKCDITLRSESGGFVATHPTKIDPLGKNRVIVRWLEDIGGSWDEKYHLRFSIVDFSNCKMKTTKLSKDLTQLIRHTFYDSDDYKYSFNFGRLTTKDFNKPIYLKGEDNFKVLSVDLSMFEVANVSAASIDVDGVASKVDRWFTYSTHLQNFLLSPDIVPLSEDKGYLLFESITYKDALKTATTVALIRPDGQRQNLTHIDDTAGEPLVSLANGLIGICIPDSSKYSTMKCTQFELGDKEINWFSASILKEFNEFKRVIYNLPRGEGFLTYQTILYAEKLYKSDKYFLKIGVDGKAKQFVDPNISCPGEFPEAGITKIFEDDRGNYCLSTACVRVSYRNYESESSFVKLHLKCFEPKDFKNVSKYEIEGEERFSQTLNIE